MLYSIATKLPTTCERFREPLSRWVGTGDISSQNHLDYIIDYIRGKEGKGGAEVEEVQKDCGVGVKLTNEQIGAIVDATIQDANQQSKKFEYLGKVKEKVPSVEGKVLKDIFEAAWKERGLPDKPVVEKIDKKEKKGEKPEKGAKKEEEPEAFQIKDISTLVGREMKSSNNSKELIKERVAKFGDVVLTRFPPEPNGYLHIGHCKAMRFDFMLAKVHGGKCYLRFDDTNPSKENQEYIDNIIENVRFMGYEPWKITHSSDIFDQLHDFAVQLIRQGDAFVCS
jgi:glutaminyl-tRNA synthetase